MYPVVFCRGAGFTLEIKIDKSDWSKLILRSWIFNQTTRKEYINFDQSNTPVLTFKALLSTLLKTFSKVSILGLPSDFFFRERNIEKSASHSISLGFE